MSNKRIAELVDRIVAEQDSQKLSDMAAELRRLLAEEVEQFTAKRESVRVDRGRFS